MTTNEIVAKIGNLRWTSATAYTTALQVCTEEGCSWEQVRAVWMALRIEAGGK